MRGLYSIDRDFKTLYTNLWNRISPDSSGAGTGSKAVSAGKAYLKSLGYKCSTNSFLFDLYSDFTKAIDADKPCILAYGAIFNGEQGGHGVFVTGYVETTSYQYLQVADGWNSYLRYINYNGYDYTFKDGWSFTVSE